MSGVDQVLAGIAGGLGGGMARYSFEQDYAQEDRKLQQRTEIENMKLEIRQMLAEAAEAGRMARHETPSGNTIATQEGQNARTAVTQEGANYRHDTASGNAILGSETARRGQDLNFTLGTTRDMTTRRGQDIGASTARRGQDIGSETARRGQDIGATTAANAEAGRNSRFVPSTRGVSLYPTTGGAGRMPQTSTPITPTGPRPSSTPITTAPPATTPAATTRAADEAEAARLIKAYDAEKDPTKKAALQRQMTEVLARLKGGGQ